MFLRSQINQMSKCQKKKKERREDESTMASIETTKIVYLGLGAIEFH